MSGSMKLYESISRLELFQIDSNLDKELTFFVDYFLLDNIDRKLYLKENILYKLNNSDLIETNLLLVMLFEITNDYKWLVSLNKILNEDYFYYYYSAIYLFYNKDFNGALELVNECIEFIDVLNERYIMFLQLKMIILISSTDEKVLIENIADQIFNLINGKKIVNIKECSKAFFNLGCYYLYQQEKNADNSLRSIKLFEYYYDCKVLYNYSEAGLPNIPVGFNLNSLSVAVSILNLYHRYNHDFVTCRESIIEEYYLAYKNKDIDDHYKFIVFFDSNNIKCGENEVLEIVELCREWNNSVINYNMYLYLKQSGREEVALIKEESMGIRQVDWCL